MAEYDFRSLTAYDFECVVRDLLQAELGQRLEAFGPGPDGGIDLRCSRGGDNLIVQCKHYAGSGYRALRADLKATEVEKVRALAPTRYVLVTSVALSPRRKEELKGILAPFVGSTNDVYGPHDLNGLLARYPQVEKRHFKLWLTSTEVLKAVLHSDVYARSEYLMARIESKAKVFVQSEAYPRAQDILRNHHCCVLAGIPGIGKTTLAEMLLLDHAARGYEIIVVSGDIDEAWAVVERDTKQVFLYDDFLGQTTSAEKLRKNEDSRLLDFVAYAKKSPRKRVIMTTREYILNDARSRYERIARGELDLLKLVLNVGDYSRFQRAQIFYNHLYFSRISTMTRSDLVAQGWYTQVVAHPNFNPRIIEHAIVQAESDGLNSSDFRHRMMSILAHPALLWEHVFEHQITADGRDLLLLMLTFEADPALEDLERTASRLWEVAPDAAHTRVRNALRTIEGTLTLSSRHWVYGAGDKVFVGFQNPSVRDFLKPRLGAQRLIAKLVSAASYFEQLELLVRYTTHRDAPVHLRTAFVSVGDQVLDACVRLLDAPPLTSKIGTFSRSQSREHRVHQTIILTRSLSKRIDRGWLLEQMESLRCSWEEGLGDRQTTVVLLRTLQSEMHLDQDPALSWIVSAKKWLRSEFEDTQDVASYSEFAEAFPSQVDEEDEETVIEAFVAMAEAEVSRLLGDAEDPDEVERALEELRSVAFDLSIDIESELRTLESLLEELPVAEPGGDGNIPERFRKEDWLDRHTASEIALLFESLL